MRLAREQCFARAPACFVNVVIQLVERALLLQAIKTRKLGDTLKWPLETFIHIHINTHTHTYAEFHPANHFNMFFKNSPLRSRSSACSIPSRCRRRSGSRALSSQPLNCRMCTRGSPTGGLRVKDHFRGRVLVCWCYFNRE